MVGDWMDVAYDIRIRIGGFVMVFFYRLSQFHSLKIPSKGIARNELSCGIKHLIELNVL